MSQMVPVVLVAEKDYNLAKIYEERFKKEKFVVVLSGDDEDTVIKVVQEKPDIIIIDLVLTGQNTFEIIQILKSMPEIKEIPIIIVSTVLEKEYLEKAAYYGAEKFLSKIECSPEDIVSQAKEIIGWSK